ncbi:long-chain fatty acid--CoA ligase [Sphingobium sufflavum]|uniref:long-chain-fatty-acid--CoA ligase n=1 Tax=Sphingobium sufflavum TaxID=1129547 RepID=UPI001F263CD9|nr:long-chain fatty acid--CoA ligase [Sphingobium sufflavum]MCE7796094.1 long-chain fatty acid--CoA ligase [Sphingobium sufflavum]
MESDAATVWREQYRHPVPWETEFPVLSVPDMLARSVARDPHAPMLDFYGRLYSYEAVQGAARRLARGLIDHGIRPGDRVGLFLPNVPHYVAAYYGAMMAGAVVVNFSPLYSVEELAHQVEDSGTRLLFTLTAKALLPTALAVLDRSGLETLVLGSVAGALPLGKAIGYRLFKRNEDAARPADPRALAMSDLLHNDGVLPERTIDPVRELALLQYTGGTTGRPKGAMLTHQNLTANARQSNAIDPLADQPERVIGVLPFFHVFANTTVLNRTIARGGEIVMLPRFDAGQTLAAIRRTRATSMPGVPTMYQALLDHPHIARTDFSGLRVCVSGGAPLAPALKERFEGVTGAKLVEGYGLTETSGVVSANPYAAEGKAGTIGQPVPGTDVRLADKGDPHRPAPPGEPGEILVAGPQIMQGYWRRPDATADCMVDGWLRTGDVGAIDADGFIRVVDRIKDMIAVGGFKVFPSEVEAVLYRHPAVRDALVIGVPDAYHGEMPKAFVTLQPDAEETAEGLRAWLNPQLGKHERVIAVEIRDSLPRTLIGKLSRKELVAEERGKARPV